ncbi:hypothetical protein EGI22_20490 [Lacihabitans sp. LS3-19]|uniref:hypothetical protein n=1 Tax=Lacihabitans sp. LS3-19 TaxID=2487335 RepID=UPI0020CE997D|nr:hypothetical protein [Lacihabitans sp. LS3-19]MCP9770291.1 hypothetical protein [Lacihabitans sp. LS3-19]
MKNYLFILCFITVKFNYAQHVEISEKQISSPKIGIGTEAPIRNLHLVGSAIMVQEQPLENIVIGTVDSVDAKFAVFSKNFGNGVIIDAPSTPGGYGLLVKGSAHIAGNLSKAGGTFKIDHPQDPLNKTLSHAFVESPQMLNIYSGNCITDTNAEAIVKLPDYFEALNQDFRYQLTVIGSFTQAIVWKKVENNAFTIKTEQPQTEVSWQITGIRKDRWALENPIVVEQIKSNSEKGKWINP